MVRLVREGSEPLNVRGEVWECAQTLAGREDWKPEGTKAPLMARDVASLHGKGEKVGIIALEESAREAALAQISLALGKRLHLPEQIVLQQSGKLANLLVNNISFQTGGEGRHGGRSLYRQRRRTGFDGRGCP